MAFGFVVLLSIAVGIGFTFRSRTSPDNEPLAGIQRLRADGRYPQALDLAREMQLKLESSTGVLAWRRADAGRLVTTLTLAAALPESTRRTLAWADGADSTIQALKIQGLYRRAVALGEKQLATRRRLLGDEHPDVARSLSVLGELAFLQSDAAGDVELQTAALALRRKVLGEKHPEVAESLELLGEAEQYLNRHAEAEASYQESLHLRRELFGQEHAAVASSLFHLGDLRRRDQRPDEAIALLGESLRMRRRFLGPHHPKTSEALCALGLTELARSGWKGAAPYIRAAAELDQKLPGTSKESLALSLSLYAGLCREEGRYAEVERVLRRDAQLYAELRSQGKPDYPSRHSLSHYFVLAVSQLKQDKGVEAWSSMEMALSRSLHDSLMPPTAISEGDGEIPALVQAGDPQFYGLQRVQSNLDEHTALIGWVELGRANVAGLDYPIWGYAIRNTGPIHWVRIDAPSRGAGSLSSTKLDRELSALASWPFRTSAGAELNETLKEVFDERISPLQPFLEGVEHLVVVWGTSMSKVPVEALTDRSGTSVGDRYTVSHTPSATLYVWMREHARPRSDPRTWRVLAVGDPGSGPEAETRAESLDLDLLAAGGSRPLVPTGRGGDPGLIDAVLARQACAHEELPLLPGSRAEVRRVAAIFPASTVLLGPRASETAIATLAAAERLGTYDLIHIATHAVVYAFQRMHTAIVLAPPSPAAIPVREAGPSFRGDGLLTSLEILSTWKIDADLVTLSACRSHRGEDPIEPLAGLMETLFRAGAHSLLVSLWPVDDTATALLMGRFYENLTGSFRDERMGRIGQSMSKALALREAKNWLRGYRDSQGRQRFENPVYWSAFILIGDAGE